MSSRSKLPSISLLWVTDPWSTLTHSSDTTLRLATEAATLGVESYWSATDFIFDAEPNQLKVVPVTPDFASWTEAQISEKFEVISASKFHQIHYRVDPPVDYNYTSNIEKLLQKGVLESQILNPIRIITEQSEKIPPADLSHLAPRLAVVQSEAEARTAYTLLSNDKQFVSKPMNLAQSIGVKQWTLPATADRFVEILKSETQNWSVPILVEEFLSEIANGEVRMWFVFDTFIAALKKHPKAGDFRVLIDEGSRVEAYHLTAGEEEISKEVGRSLLKQHVGMAAIDFISGKICDYNLTSPGLLIQLETVHGKNLAAKVIETLVNHAAKELEA